MNTEAYFDPNKKYYKGGTTPKYTLYPFHTANDTHKINRGNDKTWVHLYFHLRQLPWEPFIPSGKSNASGPFPLFL